MVSVVIPCFNYGHLIADSIRSIIQQTYTDWEIIVISDGSTDNTEQVVKSYAQSDKRIHFYYQPNTGLGASRNKALQYVKGDFIQFLDADDLVEQDKFKVQLALFEKNPEADIVYGSVRYFSREPYNPKDRLLTYWGPDEEWMPKVSGRGRALLPVTLKGNFSHLSSPLFRRTIVEKVGLFDNEISAVADYHFLLRCCVANAFFFYHDTPGTYSLVRWHPDNMSKNLNRMWSEEMKMRRKLAPLLADMPEAAFLNENAIKSFSLKLKKSWKGVFLSGGPFDPVKKLLRRLGLERLAQKIFYSK